MYGTDLGMAIKLKKYRKIIEKLLKKEELTNEEKEYLKRQKLM